MPCLRISFVARVLSKPPESKANALIFVIQPLSYPSLE
jgi:hypothetical protein